MFNPSGCGVRFETKFDGDERINMRVVRTGYGAEQVIGTHTSKSAYYISQLQANYTQHFRSASDVKLTK